jgi:signal transduction histidine kinase
LGTIPYEACLEALPIGTIVVDQQGSILYANLAARRFGVLPFLRTLPGGGEGPEGAFTVQVPLEGSIDPADVRVHVRSVPGANGAAWGECRLVVLEEIPPSGSLFQIVSNVRHEINNSLMGLLGQVELLLGRADLSETARQKVGQVQAEAERIRSRVADLGAIRKL